MAVLYHISLAPLSLKRKWFRNLIRNCYLVKVHIVCPVKNNNDNGFIINHCYYIKPLLQLLYQHARNHIIMMLQSYGFRNPLNSSAIFTVQLLNMDHVIRD